MKQLIEYALLPFVSAVLVFILEPVIRRIAEYVGLVDKPNARKVHTTLVPLIGGILVFISAMVSMLLNKSLLSNFHQLYILISGASLLLVIGVLDDRFDVRATWKFAIQIALSYYVFASGIRIDSLFGIFGIHEIPLFAQYTLTIVVITGCVNAFNLTDGIDGLAAGLALLGLTAFTVLAFLLNLPQLAVLYLAIIGGLLAFLRFNLSTKQKIFFGDAGSLFLGYILVVSGIILIQAAQSTSYISPTLVTVIGVLALPVADSIRVYRSRIKSGVSPFRADKTHLHHLILDFGVKHPAATSIILVIACSVLVIVELLGSFFSLTLTLILMLVLFSLISKILVLNREVNTWRQNIARLEKTKHVE